MISIPPESVSVFQANPKDLLGEAENVFQGTITKQRRFGALLNHVIAGGGVALNAVSAHAPTDDPRTGPGDTVFVWIPAAAIATEPIEEENEA